MRRATLLLLSAIGLLGCDLSPPRLIEARPPGDTRDPSGPYRFEAILGGVINDVWLEWRRDEGEPQRLALRDRGDGLWQAELPGAPFGSRLELVLRAEGPEGTLKGPVDEDAWRFRVRFDEGPCLVDGDCLPGEICDRLRRECKRPPGACTDDGDCPQDDICDAEAGACRFRPSTCDSGADAECGPGLVCEAGLCVSRPECGRDAECPEGARCLVPPGRCIGEGECVADAQCPADRPRCVESQCVRAAEPCGGPCPEGSQCVDDVCVPDAGPCEACPADAPRCHPEDLRCVECFADGHCPGAHCDVARNTCAPGERRRPCLDCSDGCGAGQGCAFDEPGICLPLCGAQRDCPDGWFCDGEICQPNEFCAGQECRLDDDCASGVCQSGLCEPVQVCTRNADCAADRRCRNERCQVLEALCTQAADCAPGTGCLAGRCVPTDPGLLCQPCPSAACGEAGLCAPFFDGTAVCLPACGQARACPNGAQCQDLGSGIALCMPNDECRPDVPCAPDAYEPNDAPDEATPLRLFDNLIEATVCPGDQDLFATPRVAGQLEIFSRESPLLVALFDENLGVIDQHELGAFDGLTLEVGPNVAWLAVLPAQGEGAYELFAFFEPNGGMCDDDVLEPNDSPERATTVRFGARIDATVCPANTDWFELRLRAGESAAVSIEADGFEGLWISGIDEDGEFLFEAPIDPGERWIEVFENRRNRRVSQHLMIDCLDCVQGSDYRLEIDPQ